MQKAYSSFGTAVVVGIDTRRAGFGLTFIAEIDVS